jgi:PDZ domain-containing secreted protein
LGYALVLVLLVAIGATKRESGHVMFVPGGAYEIAGRIEVPEDVRHEMGRLAFTAVLAQDATWADIIGVSLTNAGELVPEREYRPPGTSQAQINQRNRRQMDESKPVAAWLGFAPPALTLPSEVRV